MSTLKTFPIQLRLLSPPPDMSFSSPWHSRASVRSSPSTPLSPYTSSSISPTSSAYYSIPPSPPYFDCDDGDGALDTELSYRPPALGTPTALHLAIKDSRYALILIYSRHSVASPKAAAAHAAFLGLATKEHLLSPAPSAPVILPRRFVLAPPPSAAPRRPDTAFYLVCVEDIRREDVPLMFGRLGVLPSMIAGRGSGAAAVAVSAQRDGRLWRCAVGNGIGAAGGVEGLLKQVRGDGKRS
jgi:hypothetical protein